MVTKYCTKFHVPSISIADFRQGAAVPPLQMRHLRPSCRIGLSCYFLVILWPFESAHSKNGNGNDGNDGNGLLGINDQYNP